MSKNIELEKKAVNSLKKVSQKYKGDTEAAHVGADKVLVELLEELGYSDVVKEYNKVPKWYV